MSSPVIDSSIPVSSVVSVSPIFVRLRSLHPSHVVTLDFRSIPSGPFDCLLKHIATNAILTATE